MKTRTVVERIGENMGPIDWAYDFRSHFKNYCTSDANRDATCERAKGLLRQLCDDGQWEACCGSWNFQRVIDVGMYDGWPYWKPTPAVCVSGPLGSEWQFFYDLTAVRRMSAVVEV